MGWLNLGGKKGKQAKGFGNSKQGKSRKRQKTFILEKIVTPSAGVGGWLQDFDSLHELLGSLSLSDLHLPNFLADSGVCPIDPFGDPTNNLPPLIDFDPLGLYHDGIATQTPYNPGGAFETLPIAVIPVDPHSPNPNNPNAIRQLLDFPLASQPLLGSIDTGVSADSPYLNYANIKKGRDYVGGDDNPLLEPGEGSEHGTFMLGIIDAINKTAPKWVGRAIDSGRWADSLVEFVDAAKASGQKNAIANLSLDLTQKNADGSVTTRYELTPQERSAIEYARQNGVMLVVAAGNDGGVMSVLGQASQEFDNIFTVGAEDINGRSNYFSYGRGLDIVADGGTTEHPNLSTVGNDLGTIAGTSVATAKVTGAISLVWAANPGLSYRQVIEILESTARDLGPSGWDDETGFGFLNTLAAVDLAKKMQPEVYQPTDFGTPTTWGGEGKVTPSERAVNFNGAIDWGKTSVQNNAGVNLRSDPGTGYDILGRISSGDTLEFDSQTEGDFVNDPNGEGSSRTWYDSRLRTQRGTAHAEATVAKAETFKNKLYWSGPSGPIVNNNDFTKWVMGQWNWRWRPWPPRLVWSPGREPTLDPPRNNMNCWEMVLFAAYKAGCVTREWLTKLYGKTTLSGNALSNWYANLPGRMASPIQTYQGGWNSGLRRGDIVFFNGASHVAIATGTKDRFGNDEVISHWIPNNRRVEVTTIQALRQRYPSHVTFGRPAWNTARLT